MVDSSSPKKFLGQHWLHDKAVLAAICDQAQVGPDDTVLEIGPGLGTLTTQLAKRASRVIAVEFDRDLAASLPGRVPASNVAIHNADILHFDLTSLPQNYKVAANVPYYITSKIVRLLLESANPPVLATLLVQKEVAERMAAAPGAMSILAVATQFYTEARLGPVVPAALFTPPPEVDSQVITLRRRDTPLFADIDQRQYFAVVRAGFSEKRKKLRSSLSGGLRLPKGQADELLAQAHIAPDARAQELSLQDWHRLTRHIFTGRSSTPAKNPLP